MSSDKGISLTPPMGWNSWYCCSETVSDERIREVAQALVDRGLAAHGWNFVNIDDCWQGPRGGKYGALQGNERFPDMGALADYVHSLGLRFGLYSTPWIGSYAGFRGGSSDHEEEAGRALPEEERLQPNQIYGRCPAGNAAGVWKVGADWLMDRDIRQWAEWGVDFVKIDWNPNDIPTTRRISRELRKCGRDIMLSLSNTADARNAGDLMDLAQMVRVTGDIKDRWESIRTIGFEHAFAWHDHIRPGHWMDLDMLQIGRIGIPNRPNPTYKPTELSFEEQRTQLSLWSLFSAPLILSCDIAGMDDATFALLTNDAVLAVDQDPLGIPARKRTGTTDGTAVFNKPLADGTAATGVFNLSGEPLKTELAINSAVTELWTGEKFTGDRIAFELPPHGVKLFRTESGQK